MHCCACQTPIVPVCRTAITSADLAELVYVQGLDANLCEKFTPISNLLQLRDCAGNLLAFNSQVVLCSQFAANLCAALLLLAPMGTAVFDTTQLVGQDCKTYTVTETPILAIDSTCIDLTASGFFNHTLTATIIVSPTAGNALTCTGNGVYVPNLCTQATLLGAGAEVVLGVTPLIGQDCLTHVVPETPLVVVDSACLNLTAGGAFGHTLTASLIVSPDPGNMLSCLPSGAYAQATTISVADTNCINLNVFGVPGAQTISADIIISPEAGNDVSCHPAGLYVNVCEKLATRPQIGPAVPGSTYLVGIDCNAYTIPIVDVNMVAVDTPCLNLTITEAPANTFTISGVPTVSPAPDNALQCTAQGLYVPTTESEVFLIPVDTNCVNMSITEAPANTFSISADITVSPAPGNALGCTPLGLFVGNATTGTVVAGDSNCINMSVSEAPAGTFTVSASPIIAPTRTGFPAGCNNIVCQADGLAVDPPNPADFGVSPTDAPVANHIAMTTGQVVTSAVHSVSLTNPSDCRSAVVDAIISIPALEVATTPEDAQLRQSVSWSSSFPSNVQALTLLTQRTLNTFLSPAFGADSEQVNVHVRFMIAPGETGTITAQETVTMVAGNSPDVLAQDTFINVLITTL